MDGKGSRELPSSNRRCSVGNDKYEEIVAYNDLLKYISKADDNPVVWKFKQITGHEGPLTPSHPSWKGSKYNVQVEWENGETTFEPLNVIAADDPVSCTIYARDNGLLSKDGWKRFKRTAFEQQKMFNMINKVKIRFNYAST